MNDYPPAPFPWKGVIAVRGPGPLNALLAVPSWGGPTEEES